MNWKSKSVSEVSKEKIWKEHVMGEGKGRHINENFRVNPLKLIQERPMPDSIVKRGKKFLDREAAFLETINRRTGRNPDGSPRESPRGAAPIVDFGNSSPRALPQPPTLNNGSRFSASREPVLNSQSARGPSTTALPQIQEHMSASPRTARTPQQGVSGSGAKSDDPFADFHKLLTDAGTTPTRKYKFPLTESQELGWISTPVADNRRADRRFNHNIKSSEMTKYANSLVQAKIVASMGARP